MLGSCTCCPYPRSVEGGGLFQCKNMTEVRDHILDAAIPTTGECKPPLSDEWRGR